MPCTSPLQGFFDGPNGQFRACREAQAAFRAGKPYDGQGAVSCGQCLDCRLKSRREWAIRSMHEWQECGQVASFLTFTFSTPALHSLCPKISWVNPWDEFSVEDQRQGVFESYSLKLEHMVKFNKDLRQRLSPHLVRFMYCGEYGGKLQRPHYHSIVFNYDFPDRKLYKRIGTKLYYNSDFLSSLWPHGHAVISDFTFDSAAYVAGYVTEKVGGKGKDFHYRGRLPEFGHSSRRPGIGAFWFDKYWSDVYPSDECVVEIKGRKLKLRPPRSYDKLMKAKDPDLFAKVVEKRKLKMLECADDNTFERLLVKHDCTKAKFSKLVKHLEDDL